jgi:Mn2+/Fe2+ NRAMP family transporter
MMVQLKPVGKVVLALSSGLLFNYFGGPRWSSWNETIATIAFVMGACFLAALSLGGAIRGSGARPAVIAFALSFLVWPALQGVSLREIGALEFFGIFEVLPAMAGGLAGLALHRFNLRISWFVASAILALSLISIGPPR